MLDQVGGVRLLHKLSGELSADDVVEALLHLDEPYRRDVVGAERASREPVALAEVVRLCAGLPLAVRVAAARIAGRTDLTLAEHVEAMTAEGPVDALTGPNQMITVVAAGLPDLDHVWS